MKAILIHNHYQQPGGEDVAFRGEAELLRQMGHDVIEYVEDNRRIDGMSKTSAALEAIWSTTTRKRLRELLQTAKPDLAHFHNTFALVSPAAYYACQDAAVAVVQTLHNYRLVCPGATFLRRGRACEDCVGRPVPSPAVFRGCWRGSRSQTAVVAAMLTVHRILGTWQRMVDVYVALTDFARRKFIEGGLPAHKIVVKPNFVHPDPGVGYRQGQYALFVGRLSPEKGIETLLRAWQKLGDVPLVVAGDGPMANEVQRSAQGKRTGELEALGQRPHWEVLRLMQNAYALVFPSLWYEGFPLTIAEALACGLPVIASRLGAAAEIVDDGRTGLLFRPGDPDDLAAKVAWAWSHPRQMAEMGREARREYELKYTAERNYQMLMDIYERAIASAKARR